MKLNITQMSEDTRQKLKKKCLRDFFSFCVAVMGYDDIIESLHGKGCEYLQGPSPRKQLTWPRGFVKTYIGTIAYSVWITLPRKEVDEFPSGVSPSDPFYCLGSNMRILIASYVIGNAMKMINLIRKKYERSQEMMMLFPEVIPDNFTKVKWSDTEACINRSEDYTESTFEAGGIGGSTTSRHYDLIIEDDLIYANKDDMTGKELQPNQEDIDKAIGWHKLASSLLVPGSHTRIHNIGTRWAKHDLIDYIEKNEPDYTHFCVAATSQSQWPIQSDLECVWPEMYGKKKLEQIYAAQGPYMFSTQYLNKPMAPEDMLFKAEWLQYYRHREDVPLTCRIFTTIDLSLWGKSANKGKDCRGVILTCGWDDHNNVWIIHYDVARFNPTEIINGMYKHYSLFKPEILGLEAVYYQKSLSHFLRIEMEKRGWLPVRELKTDTTISKDNRIRALEPYASNLAIHCRPDHKDFIEEYCSFSPGNDTCTKDILDALAYQLQIARPGVAITQELTLKDRIEALQKVDFTQVSTDSFFEHAWRHNRVKGLFGAYELRDEDMKDDTDQLDPFKDLMLKE